MVVVAVLDDDRLDETFAALANSTRRAILARLAEGAATVNELAAPFEMKLPAVSKHIKVLERAGLVVRGQQAQYRPVALHAAPLEEVASWADHYRPMWETSFDRMDDYLAQLRREEGPMSDNGIADSVVIERIFDAPIERIWQMWTIPEHFQSWYGPTGATIPVAKMDVRVGGARLICIEMQTPNGPMQMWFGGEYLDVVENERLVYTDAISDEHGVAIPSTDMSGAHDRTEVRVELTAVDDRTRMVMTHFGVPAESPGATGWNMAFDKLTAVLER